MYSSRNSMAYTHPNQSASQFPPPSPPSPPGHLTSTRNSSVSSLHSDSSYKSPYKDSYRNSQVDSFDYNHENAASHPNVPSYYGHQTGATSNPTVGSYYQAYAAPDTNRGSYYNQGNVVSDSNRASYYPQTNTASNPRASTYNNQSEPGFTEPMRYYSRQNDHFEDLDLREQEPDSAAPRGIDEEKDTSDEKSKGYCGPIGACLFVPYMACFSCYRNARYGDGGEWKDEKKRKSVGS